jgi:uncharacterized protein
MSDENPDGTSNPSDNDTFVDIVAARISRRGFLRGGVAAAAAFSLDGDRSLMNALPSFTRFGSGPLLGFKGVAVSSADAVIVPKGYTAKVLIAWGDPVSNGPAFLADASNTATEQAQQWGMHNDGLAYFPIDGSRRGLLVQNNEYFDAALLFPDGTANWTALKTNKSLAAHGVSIVEIKKQHGWQVVRPSKYARRITAATPIRISGPVAGDRRLITSADPTGRLVLGTLHNCAMGVTPWRTFLTCEENFENYFRTAVIPPAGSIEARYGLNPDGGGYLVHTTEKRFRVADEPNEPNRFGWVVEIDPFQPNSTPVKRTALGRLKHEGACVRETRDGRIVVFMGDDETFEYIYRYVSSLPWRTAQKQGASPLDDGVLYVAKFNADGTGQWLALTPSNPALRKWANHDILINTRGAADAVGATKMDRPEWIDTLPNELTAMVSLTNNTLRGVGANAPADRMNPRSPNPYGHIIRWSQSEDWAERDFRWDIFALCGDPANPSHKSTIVGDTYGSPDGLYVAPSGRVWIQTDVTKSSINEGPFAGFGNNQMLCIDPRTRETRRFLVGPNRCEITGVCATPDETTMFVGIQHPGESPTGINDPAEPKRYSSWPDGPNGGRPRSACVVITKDDGGVIGS